MRSVSRRPFARIPAWHMTGVAALAISVAAIYTAHHALVTLLGSLDACPGRAWSEVANCIYRLPELAFLGFLGNAAIVSASAVTLGVVTWRCLEALCKGRISRK